MSSSPISVTTLDLLRHGECADGDIFRGRTDSLLSSTGHQQMQQAIEEGAANWDGIISSPLQRCLQFSQQLASQKNLPLATNAGFQEISFGDWEGLLTEDIEAVAAEPLAAYWLDRENNTPPNGEPLADFHQRTYAALQQLLDQQQGSHQLLITHGGVVRSLIAHTLKIPLHAMQHIDVPYACRTRIKVFRSPDHPDWMQLMHHHPLTNN